MSSLTKPLRAWQAYTEKPWFNVAVTAVAALLLIGPYLAYGQNVSIPEHDYLDQIDRLGTYKDGKILETSWHPFRFTVHHFGFFTAYVANEVLYRSLGFAGMWLLVTRLTKPFVFPRLFITLVACAFAALPYWPQGRLSVAGIPLAFYAAANLIERRHLVVSLLLLALYAGMSSLVLSGLFLIALLSLVLVYEGAHKRWHPALLVGIGVLCGVYVLSNSALFEVASGTLGGESSRSQLKASSYRGEKLQASLERIMELVTDAQLHTRTNHRSVIIPTMIACVAFLVAKERWRSKRLVGWFLAYLGFSAVVYASYHNKYILALYERLGFAFNYTRWYFLLPAMWYSVWALVLADTLGASENKRRAWSACLALLAFQLGSNMRDYRESVVLGRPTFAEFTSTKLFDRVKAHLKLADDEVIGCVGFHPAAARYNELNTIGFYRSSYSLEEKRRIARILQPVMDRSPTIERYFTHWGSRAYLFDDEIGTYLSAQSRMRGIPSIEVNFDIQALEDAKVRYLLSTVPFRNAEQAGYRLIYSDDNNYYRMFVYRVY